MRYSAILGWLLLTPGIYQLVNNKYQSDCAKKPRSLAGSWSLEQPTKTSIPVTFYDRLLEQYAQNQPKQFIHYLSKTLILIVALQLNSTLHYGVIYRLNDHLNFNGLFAPLADLSNSIIVLSHTFIGITPHALYLHDHFEGYDQILAITYFDSQGNEQWLPFINPQGRLLAPNWGRVQSMWANVAVTPHIETQRLAKFIMKITAFWGNKIGLDLNQATFNIKLKKISTPTVWEYDLRNKNLQGQWQNIGAANWQNFRFSIKFSDKLTKK
jgi:hypothetical protein